jgi:hypothetical protein
MLNPSNLVCGLTLGLMVQSLFVTFLPIVGQKMEVLSEINHMINFRNTIVHTTLSKYRQFYIHFVRRKIHLFKNSHYRPQYICVPSVHRDVLGPKKSGERKIEVSQIRMQA